MIYNCYKMRFMHILVRLHKWMWTKARKKIIKKCNQNLSEPHFGSYVDGSLAKLIKREQCHEQAFYELQCSCYICLQEGAPQKSAWTIDEWLGMGWFSLLDWPFVLKFRGIWLLLLHSVISHLLLKACTDIKFPLTVRVTMSAIRMKVIAVITLKKLCTSQKLNARGLWMHIPMRMERN